MKKVLFALLAILIIIGSVGCSSKDNTPINLEDYYSVKFFKSGVDSSMRAQVEVDKDGLQVAIEQRVNLDLAKQDDYVTYSLILASISDWVEPNKNLEIGDKVTLFVQANDAAYLKKQGITVVEVEKEYTFDGVTE